MRVLNFKTHAFVTVSFVVDLFLVFGEKIFVVETSVIVNIVSLNLSSCIF